MVRRVSVQAAAPGSMGRDDNLSSSPIPELHFRQRLFGLPLCRLALDRLASGEQHIPRPNGDLLDMQRHASDSQGKSECRSQLSRLSATAR